MSIKIFQGAVAPESLTALGSTGSSGADLTLVSAATLSVKRPDGTTVSWGTTVVSATPTSIVLSHPWAPGETDQLGVHGIVALCTVPSGTVRIRMVPINVIDPFTWP